MPTLDDKLEEFFSGLEKSAKQSTIRDLSPIRGVEAVLFKQKYGSVMDNPTTILPCGCIYFELSNFYKEKSWIYISVCPIHSIVESIRNSF
jgi:hypothetical protein